jgi:hypothetical protein
MASDGRRGVSSLLQVNNMVIFAHSGARPEEKQSNEEVNRMSDDNKSDDNKKGNAILDVINTLKTNPKALYAAIGAVVLVILAIALGGGGEEVKVKVAIGPGQTVTLENPNGGNSHLTAVPGLQSASEAEENKDQSICVAKGGTKATVEEEQVVGQLPYVKVKVLDGECQGKSGWTSKVNIKAG